VLLPEGMMWRQLRLQLATALLVQLESPRHRCAAMLLLDAPLDTLSVACPIVDGHQASHRNCSKTFLVSGPPASRLRPGEPHVRVGP
jgi:hypothetical protein